MGACESCAGDRSRSEADRLSLNSNGTAAAASGSASSTADIEVQQTPKRVRHRRLQPAADGGTSSDSGESDSGDDSAAADGAAAASPKELAEKFAGEDPKEVMAQIPDFAMDAFRKEWAELDADKSGSIEGREFYMMLRKLYRPSDAEVQDLMRRFDSDGDGEIDFNEFRRALASVNKKFAKKRYRRQLKKLFRWHDKDGDGVLAGEDELKGLVRSMLTIPEHVSRTAWLLFDRDGDRRVSFEEFVVTIWKLQGSLEAIWGFHGVGADARERRTEGTTLTRLSSRDRLLTLSAPEEAVLPPSYFTKSLDEAGVKYREAGPATDHVYAHTPAEEVDPPSGGGDDSS